MRSKQGGNRRKSKWSSALALAVLFGPAPAFAQTQSLAGDWTFSSTFKAIGCVISGGATLTRTGSGNVYDVRLSAVERCEYETNAPVEQRCIARHTAENVSIRCQVVGIEPGRAYLPDDFELVVRGPDLMSGLLTANWNMPAVWRRAGDGDEDDSVPIA